MTTQLIQREELSSTLQQLLTKEKAMLEAIEKVLISLPEGTIRVSLERNLIILREYVTALEAGFVPVDIRGLIRTDTKEKWRKADVKTALASMPEEARQAWEDAKELGLFKSFSITIGGDPVLVGNAGKKTFLVACWVCVTGGTSVGFRFKK